MSAKNIDSKYINVVDASVFKKNIKSQKDNLADDVIRKLVLLQKETDESLKQLSEMCLKGENGQ